MQIDKRFRNSFSPKYIFSSILIMISKTSLASFFLRGLPTGRVVRLPDDTLSVCARGARCFERVFCKLARHNRSRLKILRTVTYRGIGNCDLTLTLNIN